MSVDPSNPTLRPAQFRLLAAGFCLPVACAGWGLGVPLHALLDPSLRFFVYVISLPPLALIAWMQFQLWRASEQPEAAKRDAGLRHVRRLFLLPFLLVGAGLVLTGGMLLFGPPRAPASVPLHMLVVVALVIDGLGLLCLPLTMRARSALPS